MRFLISYDLSNNKKRTKLAKILENFGTRIQYSLFEFNLTKAEKTELFHKLKNKDYLNNKYSIMYIPICATCLSKNKRYGSEDFISKSGIIL